MKLSVIIPAYNVEKYIDRCLLSLLSQDLPHEEYEVIVVNDGSKDGTLALVQNLAVKYSNIIVIDKQNEGLSMTRNAGLNRATGEYVLFVDSDDYVSDGCLKSIYDRMKGDALDILEFGFENVDEQGDIVPSGGFVGVAQRAQCGAVSGRDYLLSSKPLIPMVWCRAYHRRFLLDNSLTMFPIRHEDEEFTPRALYLAPRVGFQRDKYYVYVWHDGSIMSAYRESSFFDMITAMGNLHRFVTTGAGGGDSALRAFIDRRIATILLMILKRSIRDGYFFQDKMVERMTQLGIYPLKGRRCSFYVVLLNFSYKYFVSYYRFKNKFKTDSKSRFK